MRHEELSAHSRKRVSAADLGPYTPECTLWTYAGRCAALCAYDCAANFTGSSLKRCAASCAVACGPESTTDIYCVQGNWSDSDYACAFAWWRAADALARYQAKLPARGCNPLELEVTEQVL